MYGHNAQFYKEIFQSVLKRPESFSVNYFLCLFLQIIIGPPQGTPRRRWVDNIEMDLMEIGWVNVD
jgi:hypothetical protein